MTNEHVKVNAELRRVHQSRRFTTNAAGQIVRGPDEEEPEELTEDAPSKSPGRADAGARGAVPVDPNASINDAIRTSARRRGT